MMKKIEITVAIPAFNEEASIKNIINQILKQEQKRFNIKKILIVSDGSGDQTVKYAKSIKSKLIHVVEGKKRLGKNLRMNQIFKISKTEILVLIDSDVIISSNNVLSKLIEPFLKNPDISHTSGHSKPIHPKSFSENVAYAGVQIWDRARFSLPTTGLYTCEGRIRAFKKQVYKKLNFPDTSADDAFSYLFAEIHGFKYAFTPQALVYFQLPSTLSDYIKQSKRFLKSEGIQNKFYDTKLVKTHYPITQFDKFKSLVSYFPINPFWTIIYLFFRLITKFQQVLSKGNDEGTWEIIKSTKLLNYNRGSN